MPHDTERLALTEATKQQFSTPRLLFRPVGKKIVRITTLKKLTRLTKKLHSMNEKKTIEQLQYRIERYRSMGNGAMCQTLLAELRELTAKK